ncbi:MAG: carboxypeptidase regulatory-like domain-containing protein [Planctomycetes bacterium]|nr:carboxypeptidase regulatory-like domain-containing protein [Planctomycetota bacterium]
MSTSTHFKIALGALLVGAVATLTWLAFEERESEGEPSITSSGRESRESPLAPTATPPSSIDTTTRTASSSVTLLLATDIEVPRDPVSVAWCPWNDDASPSERLAAIRAATSAEFAFGQAITFEPPTFPVIVAVRAASNSFASAVVASSGEHRLEWTESHSIGGRVTTVANLGLAGAAIESIVDDPSTPQLAGLALLPAHASTNATGEFHLDGIPAGPLRLRAALDRSSIDESEVVTVPSPTPIALRLHPAASIGGTIVDAATKNAIADVTIQISLRAGALTRPDVQLTAASDASGHFGPLPVAATPHRVVLVAHADGFASSSQIVGPVSPASHSDVVVELARPRSASGTVVDDDGKGLPSVRIRVLDMETLGSITTQQTDAAGRFVLPDLDPARDVRVQASLTGYLEREYTWSAPCDSPIEIVLPRLGEIRGRVTDASGRPVAARVRAIDDDPQLGRGTGKETISDSATGEYSLVGLHRTPHVVDVTAPGYAPERRYPVVLHFATEPLVLDFQLAGGGSIRGRVVDRESGVPIPGAEVKLADLDSGGTLMGALSEPLATDAAGAFRIDHIDTDVESVVVASHHGFTTEIARFIAAVDETQIPDILLSKASGLTIEVLDREGRPATGFESLVQSKTVTFSRTRSTEDASLTFDDLPPDTYEVKVSVPDAISGVERQVLARTVTLEAGSTTPLRFELAVGATLRGQVKGSTAKRYHRTVEIVSTTPDLELVRACKLAEDGYFVLAGHPPGRHTITVLSNHPSMRCGRGIVVDVPESGDVVVDLQAPDSGFAGLVRDQSGSVLFDARIDLFNVDRFPTVPSTSKYRRTQFATPAMEDGWVRFLAPLAGTYVALATAPGHGHEIFNFTIADDTTVVEHAFTLGPEATAEVRVTDLEGTSIDVDDAMLRASADTLNGFALNPRADAPPQRIVFRGLTTGVYTCHVEARAFWPGSVTFQAEAGKTVSATLGLRRRGTLRVQVSDRDGLPMRGTPASAIDLTTQTDVSDWLGKFGFTTSTDTMSTAPDGVLELRELPEGRYRVTLGAESVEVDVVGGEVVTIDVVDPTG